MFGESLGGETAHCEVEMELRRVVNILYANVCSMQRARRSGGG